MRYEELHWFTIEAMTGRDGSTIAVATASLSGLQQTWTSPLPAGLVQLRVETDPYMSMTLQGMGGERIRLIAAAVGSADVVVAELDGRYWSAETTGAFTGRVAGLCATEGTVRFADVTYRGTDGPSL